MVGAQTLKVSSVTDATHLVLNALYSGPTAANTRWSVFLPVSSDCTSEPLTVVDASITIAPNDTNFVGFPHTFTVTVKQDTGNGQGLQPVGAGVPVTVTLTPSNGANPVPAGPFNVTTDANGHAFVTFTSASGGKVLGSATTTFSVAGVSLTRSTDATGNNSGPATKFFQ